MNPAWLRGISETQTFFLSVQMIAAQKQLIENADAVQERIAQVQREGKVHRMNVYDEVITN